MDGLRATRRIKAARSAKVIKPPRPWLLLALALSVASPASAQAPGTWAPIADLNQPRAEHTATLLANGTVLIAGGRRGASPRRAAQLFDPATDTFTALGPMSTPRGRHTATLLRDGRVVVIGGTDGVKPLASLEIYDPTTRTFSLAPSALAVVRQDHTTTLLPDGRILVVGGSNASGALDSAEIYDPTAGTVSPAAPLNVPRTLASAALLLDGTVLVAGGQTTSEDLDSAEVYDAATNTFAWLPAAMGTARSGHLGVQLLHNGKVLISGGTSGGQLVANAEVYDPITGAFQPVDSPGTARRLFGANFFEVPYTGILLASGGFDGSDQPLASSEVFFYPTLRSDKPDYAPGETVTLMGEGWRPNEQVAINIRESSGDPDTNLTATADTSGAFTNSEFQTNPDRSDIGVRFLATATGQSSRWTAQTTFSDTAQFTATINPTSATVNTATTYTLTVTNTSTAMEVMDCVRVTIPAGAGTPGSLSVVATDPGPTTRTWNTPTTSGGVITTTRSGGSANSIDPGGTVAISFTATATTTGTKTWTTSAFGQTNCSGQAFTITPSGSQPSVIVSAPPTIAINDVTVTEGNGGTTNAIFSVTLSAASSQTITVTYATADGTATTADNDYVAASGTVTFAPGVTSQPVTVTVNGDTKFEPDETFFVNLSNPTGGATISDGQGQGTIVNDDTAPTLAIDDVSQAEGSTGGTTAFTFTVTKTGATAQSVTVGFTTVDGTATGNSSCAAAGTGTPDYISQTGTLTFAPSDPSKTITVQVCADTTFELSEAFTVKLSGATGATITKDTGTGTIVNDDTAPTLAIDDVSQAEGSTGGTTAFTFTVTKTGATAQSVTVGFTTVDGTATGNSSCAAAATGTPDYISQTGTLTFAPSDPSKTITVQVCADTTFELSEAFTVKLSGATNATITKDTGTGTIVNDDTAPTLAIDDVSQAEGSTGGTTAFTFTVTKTGATK